MSQPAAPRRIQVFKARARWAARWADSPEELFIGRSCAEALGRLFVACYRELGCSIAGYVHAGERHVPLSEPAGRFDRRTIIEEAMEYKSLPPLWTLGPRGRDRYYAVPHPNQKRPEEAA